jgi:hypothetical protein
MHNMIRAGLTDCLDVTRHVYMNMVKVRSTITLVIHCLVLCPVPLSLVLPREHVQSLLIPTRISESFHFTIEFSLRLVKIGPIEVMQNDDVGLFGGQFFPCFPLWHIVH